MSDPLRRIAGALGAVALLACAADAAPGQVPGHPYAYLANDCGPADGPAVTLYLSERAADSLPPAGRYFVVTVWAGREEALGRTFRSSDEPVRGAALVCPSAATCEPVSPWRVTLRSPARDTVDGSVDLLPGGRRVAGTFRARWTPQRILCG